MEVAWLRNIPELLGLSDFALDDADIDGYGNIYISDCVNGQVYRFKPDGSLDDVFAIEVSPNELSLNLAVTLEGDFYLAYALSERVVRYDSKGNFLGEFAVPGILTLCRAPEGLIYVLASEDEREEIRVCDPLGWVIETLPAPPRHRSFLDPGLTNLDADAEGNIYVSYGMPPYCVWKVRPDGFLAGTWSRPIDHPEDAVLISDIAFDPLARVVRVLLARRESGLQELDAFNLEGEFLGVSRIPHSDSLYGVICASPDGTLYLLETANSPGSGILAQLAVDK
jgi:hypothetical protein